MTKDLTTGNPAGVLWRFTLPMFISVVFQQLYNIADSAIAGKFSGEDALAAIGASYPITMIFMAVAVGSNVGCAVVISQLFGAKRYDRVKTAVSTTLISSLILAVLLTVLGLIFSAPLMRMIKTPVNIFNDGALYLKVYIAGMTFLFLYNVVTGIFTAMGDSRTPLYFLIGSSIGNVVLDYLFVAVFSWGVAGVAWATFIAQGAACLLALQAMYRRVSAIKTQGRVQVFSFEMFKKIAKISIPSILQQSFVSVGNIFVQGLVNGFGSSVIAGYSAAIKLNTFTITSFTTISNGLSSFTAQNIGAGREERVKEGYKAGTLLSFCIAVPFFILFFFFGGEMMSLFMESKSAGAFAAGEEFLRIVSPFYFVICAKVAADGVLRGGGAMICFMISTFTDLIIRVVLAFLLSPLFGASGIWASWPLGWVVAAILSISFCLAGKWKSCPVYQ